MIALVALYHIAKSDFLERTRRFSFLVMLAATVYLGYLFVPPVDASYQTVTLGNARGIYNSPWIGAMFGLMLSTTVSILAFYLTNNAVRRDRQTRVGEIIASSPVPKHVYILGKWMSNFGVLIVMMAVLTLAAAGMQYFRAEDTYINLWALALPLWLIGLPVMATVAAMAVLFESIPFLSGGFGNVAYFFVWIMILMAFLLTAIGDDMGMIHDYNDLFGISRTIADMQRVIHTLDPTYTGNFSIGADSILDDPLIFEWTGLRWTARLIGERMSWVLLAIGVAVLAALPFDRFDPAKRKVKRNKLAVLENNNAQNETLPVQAAELHTLTPLVNRPTQGRFFTTLYAEFRLMLSGQPWWWYVLALGLGIAGAVTPLTVAPVPLAVAWLWPILIWSPMGVRELRYDTHELIFSLPRVLVRQLAAMWLSGMAVALLASSGGMISALTAGKVAQAVMILVGACFVPALALALGVWSHSSRLFEVTYLLLWYLALNGLGALDFMGLGLAVAPPNTTLIYAGLTASLLIASVIGRAQQFQR